MSSHAIPKIEQPEEERIKKQLLRRVAVSKFILSITMGLLSGYFGVRGSNGLSLYLGVSSSLGVLAVGQSAVNEGKVKNGEVFLEALAPATSLYILIWAMVLDHFHPLKL
ncbi:hypothetical protein HMI54_009067 [Coelomomyces lativittatus]|nr:hypothetical protein HMI54_009067 [Coelomomyces lativittatus]KAJ1508409.1 hypothetical protein HMI56_007302 [Coelomomyces lativittatus]KAJ1511561.1 hypothetical protein HMI55_006540 [Coelomomyces lativittatus]